MSSSTTAGRKETERTKLIQEKCQTLLTQMLRDEDNKYCVDCDAKGPRWASWNLGVFLCIRCAGIHRNLGVHISRVKSVNLDTWTPEQVISLQQMGNSRARAVYEAQLPDGFRRPQTDTALESFIRAKYEHKKYIAREWVPPLPPKVDWAKEIDEELERQKRKKKAAQASASLGVGIISGSSSSNDKKNLNSNSLATNSIKSINLPTLPKPKSNHPSGSSPKTQRISVGSNDGNQINSSSSVVATNATTTNDLLGLSSPIKNSGMQNCSGSVTSSNNINTNSNCNNGLSDFGQNDHFSGFLDASSQQQQQQQQHHHQNGLSNNQQQQQQQQQNSLAKEEEDFFNQGSLNSGGGGVGGGGGGLGEKDSNGKLTKDSILALYGNSDPKTTTMNPGMMVFGQTPDPNHSGLMMLGQNPATNPGLMTNPGMMVFGQNPAALQGSGGVGGMWTGARSNAFAGLPPGYPNIPGQQQFMTPPNSTSLYNTPVMTAPAAFSAPGMNSMQMAAGTGGFATQTPMQGIQTSFPTMNPTGAQQNMMAMNRAVPGAGGNGFMQNNSSQSPLSPMNVQQNAANTMAMMQTNQNLLSGLSLGAMTGGGQQNQMLAGRSAAPMIPMSSFPTMSGMNTAFPTIANPAATAAAAANSTNANLNQQFGNLNLGNVWQ